MKKYIITLLITFFVFAYSYLIMYKNLTHQTEIINKEKNILSQQIELLKNGWMETLIASTANIEKELYLLDNDKKIAINKLITTKTLVIKIPHDVCQPCLQRELENIATFEKETIPIIIIAAYSNKNEINNLLRKHNIQSKLYLINPNQDILQLGENFPSSIYMFLTDKDLSVKYLFFPVQSINDLSKTYFQFIKNIAS